MSLSAVVVVILLLVSLLSLLLLLVLLLSSLLLLLSLMLVSLSVVVVVGIVVGVVIVVVVAVVGIVVVVVLIVVVGVGVGVVVVVVGIVVGGIVVGKKPLNTIWCHGCAVELAVEIVKKRKCACVIIIDRFDGKGIDSGDGGQVICIRFVEIFVLFSQNFEFDRTVPRNRSLLKTIAICNSNLIVFRRVLPVTATPTEAELGPVCLLQTSGCDGTCRAFSSNIILRSARRVLV